MAQSVQIGGGGTLFLGEDKTLRLEVLDATLRIPVDISAWTSSFYLAASNDSTILLAKPTTITGTFNAVRALNTQRFICQLAHVDTINLGGSSYKFTTFRYTWRRTDAGADTVLAYGDAIFEHGPDA